MSLPLVSIIMPAKDVARYISEAVNSVMEQDYVNWELIIVENASSDNTAAVISRYTDKRIRILSSKTAGLSNARNIGLENMNGAFFCFLDADDRLAPGSISRRVAVFSNDPQVMFVDGAMAQYNESMSKVRYTWKPSFRGVPTQEMMYLLPRCFCGITWMIRRAQDASFRFDTSWTHLEDRLFFLSISPLGRYEFIAEEVYHVRRRRGSLMADISALEEAYLRYLNHVHGMGLLDADIMKKEMHSFHRMFFRTDLKKFRFMKALRHLYSMLIHKA